MKYVPSMKTTLITVDGVLRKPVGGAPIPEGMRLYAGLATSGHTILLSTAMTEEARAQVNDWLELNGCTGHDFVAWQDGSTLSLANYLRRQGYDIDLVIVPDPGDASYLIGAGFNTLLFTHSKFAVPEWRPDAAKGVRAWDSITQQVADLARMKAADSRLRDESC